jgi:hypothetical protein
MSNPLLKRAEEAAYAVGEGQAEWREAVETTLALMGAERGVLICSEKQTEHEVLAIENVGHDAKTMQAYTDYYYQFDDMVPIIFMPTGSWLVKRYDNKASESSQRYWTELFHPNRITETLGFKIGDDSGMIGAVTAQLDKPRNWTPAQWRDIRQHHQNLCNAFTRRRQLTKENLQIAFDAPHASGAGGGGGSSFYRIWGAWLQGVRVWRRCLPAAVC